MSPDEHRSGSAVDAITPPSGSLIAVPNPATAASSQAQDDARALIDAAERRRGPRRRRRTNPSTLVAAPVPPRAPRQRKAERETRATAEAMAPLVPNASRRAGVWLISAFAAGLSLIILSGFAAAHAPERPTVIAVRWDFSDGPRVSQREANAWLTTFPDRSALRAPDSYTLQRLRSWLGNQSMVDAVDRVAWDVESSERGLRGALAISARLHPAILPAQTAAGERVWLGTDGRILPGALPAPAGVAPVVKSCDTASSENRREAVQAWLLLKGKIEAGLITSVELDAAIDERTRGLVFTTRHGTRITWGRPDDARVGMSSAEKAGELLHVLACQGDPSHLRAINLRFRRATFVLND